MMTHYSTMTNNSMVEGAQWLSGRVLVLRPRGHGFEPHRRHCVVSLSKNINPSLVLVQPRKAHPFITEIMLIGRKESNQTNKQNSMVASASLWSIIIAQFSGKAQFSITAVHDPMQYNGSLQYYNPVQYHGQCAIYSLQYHDPMQYNGKLSSASLQYHDSVLNRIMVGQDSIMFN